MNTPTSIPTEDEREHGRDLAPEPKPARETPERDRHGRLPPAGPHDSPDLTNPDATPGTGVLPGRGREGVDTDPGGG
ncbi:hypothetical protein ACTZWW_09515 [Salinarimonas sp. NSM]|uniref:hypothetical protein n=1 Tax=Salinarimonas sp. NSM TaxID=3458003 RepID=UPI0040375136